MPEEEEKKSSKRHPDKVEVEGSNLCGYPVVESPDVPSGGDLVLCDPREWLRREIARRTGLPLEYIKVRFTDEEEEQEGHVCDSDV